MAHHFTPGQGFFVREPSWHGLEGKILTDWPGSWEEARAEAGLLWEPVSTPLYVEIGENVFGPTYELLEDYQRIGKSDNGKTLGIQTKSYRVINNTEFGQVIETVLGADIDLTGKQVEIKYEGVFELYGGAQVFAMVYLGEAHTIPGDNSLTYTYAVFYTRHDGNGGLRCIITNVRVVCANTAAMAEAGAKEDETAFTIQHSKNWDERVGEVRDKLQAALANNEAYFTLCSDLATKKVTPNTTEKMIKRFLPLGDDMGPRQTLNRENEREVLRTLLKGPTISTEHRNTPYGFLMAATEWSDHYRGHRTQSSYVSRQLTQTQPLKVKAFTIAKQFARS